MLERYEITTDMDSSAPAEKEDIEQIASWARPIVRFDFIGQME